MELQAQHSKQEESPVLSNGLRTLPLINDEIRNRLPIAAAFSEAVTSSNGSEQVEMGTSLTHNSDDGFGRNGDGRSANESAGLADWTAMVGISMPGGTCVHPSFLTRVEDELHHFEPAVDCRHDGVRVCCRVYEPTKEGALKVATEVADRLLGMLALSTATITEFRVSPIVRNQAIPSCKLRLVR
jgi:hypothetical protein